MVILTITLLISIILLWLFDKSNLLVLGFRPTKNRIENFVFGLAASSILCACCCYLIAIILKKTLTFNTDFTYKTFLDSTFWMLQSVMSEELLFRGALLYIGIKKLGVRNACILSSIAFGIYHWFTHGILGDVPQMIYIFILTGIGGLLFAYSFALTKSIYLPVGLHLGWNLISVVIFSQGPLGNQLLVVSGGHPLDGVWSIIIFIYQITLLPFVTWLYLRRQKGVVDKEQQLAKSFIIHKQKTNHEA
jgi:membrane protease YdiL (CAAX protease family)